jgi:hypothetical protein
MKRTLTSLDELEEEEIEKRARYARLEEINQELELYTPEGYWAYFERRLRKGEIEAQAALEAGTPETFYANKARLQTYRYLLAVPERLREERARLLENIDE